MVASTNHGLHTGRRTGPPRKLMAIFSPAAAAAYVFSQLVPRVSASTSSTSSPAVFPYTPTTILAPSNDSSVVYIFSPNDSGQVEFLSLNISSTLSSSSSSNIKTLAPSVPFLPDNDQHNTASTFTASLQSDGAVVIFAGECAPTASSSSTVWTYVPENSTSQPSSISKWTSSPVSLTSSQSGPWFLGGSMAFSNQIAPTQSNATIYVYGGMCPSNASSTSITANNWQSHASYSNQMLKLVPSSNTYTSSVVSSKGPPIAEAGFTFTQLLPSLANHSGIVTQQANSVLLGGHTETAFINMSTAAIWSLPEETWSFVSIANPSSSPNTELAVVRKAGLSSTSAPDSRSGHTAVLSEDGNSIVVLGGWVGDVTQAANPQLAVLEMGPDYGQWQWSIPSQQPSGTGMYGHGAALLPGNVMMVYGGYNITTSSSAKLMKRQSSSTGSSLMFFNLTSLSWVTEYSNPTHDTPTTSLTAPNGSVSSSSASKIGLGVGLGLGIPLALLVLFLLFRSCRRRSRQRRRRNEAVRALAQDHNQFLHGHDEMIESGAHAPLPFHWGPRDARGFYTGGHDPYNVGTRSLGFESLRGTQSSPAFPGYQPPHAGGDGADDRHSPEGAFASASGLRKPPRNVARGLYQPTTINDYESLLAMGGVAAAASGSGSNIIHPIYEADEEDEEAETGRKGGYAAVAAGTAESTGRSISPETEELTDPFLTPSTMSVIAPLRPGYTGALGPNTVNLNPFVRNTPTPEAGATRSRLPRLSALGGGDAAIGEAGDAAAGAAAGEAAAGQDRDVQEWVAGLEIEDLLFAAPLPGAAAAVAASASPAPGQMGPACTQRGRVSPTNLNRRTSIRSRTSGGGSPTRSSFFGAGTAAAAAAVAGAVASVTAGWGAGEDETRTGSNLSDRSAFTFLSRTASSRSRLGGAGAHGVVDPKAVSSDSSSASFNTAPSGFHTLRAEGPALLYGKGHKNGSSASGSLGDRSAFGAGTNSSGSSIRGGAISPTGYGANASQPLPSPGAGAGAEALGQQLYFSEYGGAAAVMASGAAAGGSAAAAGAAYESDYRHSQRSINDEDENAALTGSPSKSKGRRTWMGSIMRIFSSGSQANPDPHGTSTDDVAFASSVGTGAQQALDYQDMAPHATLLRRKQGRFDWEADEVREEESTAVGALRMGRSASMGSIGGPSHNRVRRTASATGGPATAGVPPGGSIAAGRRDGSGKSDDWDVEQAVQNRVVQVMFTMPRDQKLRVVNAEVEQDDDEAEVSTVNTVARPHEEHNLGGLSAPPPPPILQRPPQSYMPISSKVDPEEHRPLPPRDTKTGRSSLDKQDEQLRLMREDLAKSKQLLAEQAALDPWMLDDDEEMHEDEAMAIPMNKGKMVDVSWIDAGGLPPRQTTPSRKPDELKLAAAAALARTLMNTTPVNVATSTAAPDQEPVTPVKHTTPARPVAALRTPTKAASADSLSTNTSSHTPRKRRGTLGGETLLGSPAAGVIKKPPGFVLDMVEKIETGSPPKA